MGETITATITMLDKNLPATWQLDVAVKLAALSGYSRDNFELDPVGQNIWSDEEIKWYGFAEGFQQLSETFTPLRMEMLVKHGSGAQTLVYAYGGKIQVEPGRVEFGPCTLWS